MSEVKDVCKSLIAKKTAVLLVAKLGIEEMIKGGDEENDEGQRGLRPLRTELRRPIARLQYRAAVTDRTCRNALVVVVVLVVAVVTVVDDLRVESVSDPSSYPHTENCTYSSDYTEQTGHPTGEPGTGLVSDKSDNPHHSSCRSHHHCKCRPQQGQ